MSRTTQLLEEAKRLLAVYDEHKDSSDEQVRRKAYVDIDRFLMENREIALVLCVNGLEDALEVLKRPNQLDSATRRPWYKRLTHISFKKKEDLTL